MQHIDHSGHGFDLVNLMDIGQHRYANLFADFRKDVETFFHAQASERTARGTIGLIERGFVDKRNAEAARDFFQLTCGIDRHLERFNDTGAGDEEKWLIKTCIEMTKLHAAFL